MKIGENIKHLRKENNMLQKDLADKLNVTKGAVSSWEVGRTEPNIGMIEAMCDIFNCQKTDLIDGPKSRSFNSGSEFELEWKKLGGGKHPINLSDHERMVVLSYRAADELDRLAVQRILRIETKKDTDVLDA